jgi:hypothetical protein
MEFHFTSPAARLKRLTSHLERVKVGDLAASVAALPILESWRLSVRKVSCVNCAVDGRSDGHAPATSDFSFHAHCKNFLRTRNRFYWLGARDGTGQLPEHKVVEFGGRIA